MTEQTCDVGLSLSTGRDATQSHISSFCPVPRDTTLTILIGLLAMTLLLAGLVTLPDGAAPDSHTLSFLPNTKGMDGLHAQVRFVLATCAMLVLLMLLHVVSLRWPAWPGQPSARRRSRDIRSQTRTRV